jgi:hypothetical protein
VIEHQAEFAPALPAPAPRRRKAAKAAVLGLSALMWARMWVGMPRWHAAPR